MSLDSYRRTLSEYPGVRERVESIVAAMQTLPAAPGIDPIVLAHLAHTDEVTVMAALGLLIQAGEGRFAVQVVNERGQAIGEFDSMEDLPETITDDYGEVHDLDRRRIRIVFRPGQAIAA